MNHSHTPFFEATTDSTSGGKLELSGQMVIDNEDIKKSCPACQAESKGVDANE